MTLFLPYLLPHSCLEESLQGGKQFFFSWDIYKCHWNGDIPQTWRFLSLLLSWPLEFVSRKQNRKLIWIIKCVLLLIDSLCAASDTKAWCVDAMSEDVDLSVRSGRKDRHQAELNSEIIEMCLNVRKRSEFYLLIYLWAFNWK